MKLFSLSRWISLTPEWLLAIGRDGRRASYRIRNRWDGRRSLVEAAVPLGKPCYLVLDAESPYRRKLQALPADEKGRQTLLRAAPDEFPLPPDVLEYGLGQRDGEAYIYALPRAELERLIEEGINAAIVLIADGAVSETACLAAIDHFERLGRSFALGGTRARYVSRRLLGRVALGSAFLASTLATAMVIAVPSMFGELAAWRTDQLKREAGDLPTVLAASESMLATQTDATRLRQLPEARLPQLLAQLFATVPPRHSIRRIEFDGRDLVVAGTGTDVKDWLTQAGFEASQISIESVGNFQRFRVVRQITGSQQ